MARSCATSIFQRVVAGPPIIRMCPFLAILTFPLLTNMFQGIGFHGKISTYAISDFANRVKIIENATYVTMYVIFILAWQEFALIEISPFN